MKIRRIRREFRKAPASYKPKPNYEIPKYEPGMKINNSKEKYLRPTTSCESIAPQIVALAHKLGAYEKSDPEYANSVFQWVKNNIKLGLGGGTATETLREGHAFCIQKSNLAIALFRAGGLRARYRATPSMQFDSRFQDFIKQAIPAIGVDEALTNLIADALATFPIYELAEVQVNGKWIVADTTFQDELEAVAGYPISKFGDDPLESWISGGKDFYYTEDTPRTMRPLFLYLKSMMGLRYKIEQVLDQSIEIGGRIIQQAGGKEKYNQGLKGPYEELQGKMSSIIEKIMAD
jgi:transglutaminase-like putative cysteine protease